MSSKGPKRNNKQKSKSVPTAVGVTRRTNQPVIKGQNGSVVVRRCEFVGSATNGSTTGYSLTSISASTPGYDLNPGCAIMFPWLSNLASSFERYRFRKLTFKFIPSQATTTPGRYYAAVDYDYDDAIPAYKVGLMGNRTAAEAPVWQELVMDTLPAELHRDMPVKYVSLASRNNFIEPRTAYCGFLLLAFDTSVQDLLIDIWVDYEVELIAPVNEYLQIQDTIGNYTPPDVANILETVGTVTASALKFANSNGLLKTVVPGSLGVPEMLAGIGGTTLPMLNALDLGAVLGKGFLSVQALVSKAGETPNELIQDNVMTPALYGFDSNGNDLGLLTPAPFNVGASGPASLGTPGDQVDARSGIFMDAMLAQFPTLRYIAAALIGTQLVGAGKAGAAFKYEL